MPRRVLATLLLVLATFATGVASAQPSTPQAAIDESRRLFQQATADYKLGHFAEALAGYSAAYEQYKAPQFLFNIAQCHFQLEQWDRAVFFFEGYLRELPAASNRALVEDLMREARQRRDEQAAAETRRLDLEQQRLELAKREDERAARERERALTATAPPPGKPIYKKWWFWTAAGAAVAGVAVVALTAGGTHMVLPEGSLGTWDRR